MTDDDISDLLIPPQNKKIAWLLPSALLHIPLSKVPLICLKKQGASQGTTFNLNTAPRVFTHLGHTVMRYLHCLGISVMPCLFDIFDSGPYNSTSVLWD